MGRLILSLFNGVLGFVFKGVVAKFFVFFGLFYVTTEFIPEIIKLFIPQELMINFQHLFSNLSNEVWYFLEIFKVPFGVSLYISAILARFIIRRIPLIG